MSSSDKIKDDDFAYQSLGHADSQFEIYSNYYGVDFPERHIAIKILAYVPPALLVIGTVGNILCAIILWRLFNGILSTCLYMFVAMIIDLVVLYVRGGNEWLTHLANVDIRERAMLSTNSVCKIYPFVSDFALHLTTWMTVAMAIETTLVTLRPQRLMRLCRLERARAVVLLLVVLLVCVNAHCFWTYARVKVEKTNLVEDLCTNMRSGNQHSEEFRKIVWPVIDILIADFFPFFIIFACVVVMITKRIKKKEHIRQLENTWKAYSMDAATGRQLHSAFITLCMFHLLLLLPKMGCNIFLFFIDPSVLGLVKFSFVLEARAMLARAVCNTLLYIFVSCKVFVFVATCRTFRAELWSLLTCAPCRGRPTVGGMGSGLSGAGMGAGSCRDRAGSAVGRLPPHQPLLTKLNDIHGVSADPASAGENAVTRKTFSMTSV